MHAFIAGRRREEKTPSLIHMPECLLDVCDINHSGVEDYTPKYIQGISREESCAEVDKVKGINNNLNSVFYCSQDNY